jgi:hypothetical protein
MLTTVFIILTILDLLHSRTKIRHVNQRKSDKMMNITNLGLSSGAGDEVDQPVMYINWSSVTSLFFFQHIFWLCGNTLVNNFLSTLFTLMRFAGYQVFHFTYSQSSLLQFIKRIKPKFNKENITHAFSQNNTKWTMGNGMFSVHILRHFSITSMMSNNLS